jgi:hypothetical protein
MADTTASKKITLATIKSFIAKNRKNLLICTRSCFDGMTDGVESCADQSFRAAVAPDLAGHVFRSLDRDNRLGIAGAWFVFESRDFFRAYEQDGLFGYRVSNCCGDFILAIRADSAKAAA